MSRKILLNTEYSALQILYWGMYSAFPGFAGVLLLSRGFSNTAIGIVIAAGGAGSMLLSPLLAAYADRHGSRSNYTLNLILTLAELLLMLPAVFLRAAEAMLLPALALYVCMLISVNPINTSICLSVSTPAAPVNYGFARGLGSLSYAVISVLLGSLIEHSSPEILPGVCLSMLFLQGLVLILLFRHSGFGSAAEDAGREQSNTVLGFFLANPRYTFFLLGVALMFFAHNTVVNFLINIVRNVGGTTQTMGQISGFMAAVELPAMFLFDRLCRKLDCRRLLRFGALCFFLKILFTALAQTVPALFASQTLQAFGFAILIPGLVRYAAESVPVQDSSKAQSITFATITLGNVLSGLFGGLLMDHLSVSAVLYLCSFLALLGLVIFQFSISRVSSTSQAH